MLPASDASPVISVIVVPIAMASSREFPAILREEIELDNIVPISEAVTLYLLEILLNLSTISIESSTAIL